MSKTYPIECPTCSGTGVVATNSLDYTCATTRPCKACQGSGVVLVTEGETMSKPELKVRSDEEEAKKAVEILKTVIDLDETTENILKVELWMRMEKAREDGQETIKHVLDIANSNKDSVRKVHLIAKACNKSICKKRYKK